MQIHVRGELQDHSLERVVLLVLERISNLFCQMDYGNA